MEQPKYLQTALVRVGNISPRQVQHDLSVFLFFVGVAPHSQRRPLLRDGSGVDSFKACRCRAICRTGRVPRETSCQPEGMGPRLRSNSQPVVLGNKTPRKSGGLEHGQRQTVLEKKVSAPSFCALLCRPTPRDTVPTYPSSSLGWIVPGGVARTSLGCVRPLG